MNKINSFKDLYAWQKGHALVLLVYQITNHLPQREQFALISQMQRGAISIISNLAEGFSRRGIKDKMHFYYIALGSTTEIENQLLVCKDLGYINEIIFNDADLLITEVKKLINGLVKSTKNRS